MISSLVGAGATGAAVATGAGGGSAAGAGAGGAAAAGAVTGSGRRDAVFDEADDVAQGGVVAQVEGVVAGDRVALADGGEHLGLFDGVDAEVGLEVELGVEHVGRVAGLGGHDLQDRGRDLLGRRRGARRDRRRSGDGRRRRVGAGSGAAARRRRGGRGRRSAGAVGARDAVFDEADDVAQGGVVAQVEGVVAGDRVALADGGEHLGLFDGVDAEVGLEVELGVEHVGRVAGLGGDDLQDRGRDLLARRRGRDRRRSGDGRGARADGRRRRGGHGRR